MYSRKIFFCLALLFSISLAQTITYSTTLKILSSVAETRVFIDSKDYGSTSNGEIAIDDLTVGKHQLLLLAEGYDTFTSTVELQEDSYLEIKVSLGKLVVTGLANAAKSNLTIQSEVDGGKVFINGYYYGDIINGEKRIINLNSGANRLTIVTKGYEPYITELSLPTGEAVLSLNFN